MMRQIIKIFKLSNYFTFSHFIINLTIKNNNDYN